MNREGLKLGEDFINNDDGSVTIVTEEGQTWVAKRIEQNTLRFRSSEELRLKDLVGTDDGPEIEEASIVDTFARFEEIMLHDARIRKVLTVEERVKHQLALDIDDLDKWMARQFKKDVRARDRAVKNGAQHVRRICPVCQLKECPASE